MHGIAGSARGSEFIVKNCIDESPFGIAAHYEGGSRVEARHCNEPDSPGLFQLNGRGGQSAEGQVGAWVWEPGPGAGVVSATIKAKLRNAGGWAAQLYALKRDGSALVFGTAPGDDEFKAFNLLAPESGSGGASRLVAQLKCYRAGGCDLATLGGATNRPDNVLLTIRDWRVPQAQASGPLLETGTWHRGPVSVRMQATDDGAGIARWELRVNGTQLMELGREYCPGDRGAFSVSLMPCLPAASADLAVNTRALDPGPHSVEFCARDYGAPEGNLGCSRPYTIRVDNEAPLQPENLQVAGGQESWHPDNDFDLTWSNPPQGAGSPIAAVRYRMLDAGGSVVVPVTRLERADSALQDLAVPAGPGHYTVEVFLEDVAGNVGPPARASLRFDNVRPSAAGPVPAGEWLSRGELPHLQVINPPVAPHPVSGIAGYAYAVDQSPSTDPCVAEDRCTIAETDLRDGLDGDRFAIADLAEGTNYVHTAAVSRSGMKSSTVEHGALLVDKTDPVTTLHGVPTVWTSESVALTATATDELSGMEDSGGDEPYTAISVDGGSPVTSSGSSVSTVVAGEGVHEISFFARDLAGNVNDGRLVDGVQNRPPGTAQVRIDRTEPGVAFASLQDPDDPEVIRAIVTDALSGPNGSAGGIAIRRVGAATGYRALPTEFDEGVLEARWNSDSFPAGEYEFRAWASDRAGNTSTSDRRTDGRVMVLPNPIKVPTAIRAGLGQTPRRLGRIRSRVVPYGARVRFSGRLTAGLGSPLGGQTIQVVERFARGSRLERRVTQVRTDGKGFFSKVLAPGPQRQVSAHYDGTRTLTRASSATSVVRPAGKITLSVSSRTARVGGRPVVFSGRIGSRLASIPPDGKEVELQFRTRSVGWTTFRSIDSNRKGVWRFAYRFVDRESRGVAFGFRAIAPRQSLWPYGGAVSRPQTVIGR